MAHEVAEYEREQHQRADEPGARANEACECDQMRSAIRLSRRDTVG
jgi:hypothetical protein